MPTNKNSLFFFHSQLINHCKRNILRKKSHIYKEELSNAKLLFGKVLNIEKEKEGDALLEELRDKTFGYSEEEDDYDEDEDENDYDEDEDEDDYNEDEDEDEEEQDENKEEQDENEERIYYDEDDEGDVSNGYSDGDDSQNYHRELEHMRTEMI